MAEKLDSFLYYFAYMISLFCSIKKKMISLFCIILINVVLEFDCGCMLVDLAIEMSIWGCHCDCTFLDYNSNISNWFHVLLDIDLGISNWYLDINCGRMLVDLG